MITASVQRIERSVAVKTLKPQIKNKVQVLRGVASLAVIWNHLGLSNYLDPGYNLSLGYVPYGNIRPLLFFMLSGYLISLGGRNNIFSWADLKHFGKKRMTRLYPVYLLIVLFTFCISLDEFSVDKLLNHLLFLQNLSGSVFSENGSLWTMNFEVLFYFVFAFISWFNVNKLYVPIGAVVIGSLLLFGNMNLPMLISFCFGLAFWGVGVYYGSCNAKESEHPTSSLIALALLLFCYQQIDASEYLLNKLQLNIIPKVSDFGHHPIKFYHLTFIPICFLILSYYNNRTHVFNRYLLGIIYIPVVVRIAYLVFYKGVPDDLYVPFALFATSLFCLLIRFKLDSNIFNKSFEFIGGISYSLYLVHFPLIFLFQRFTFFSGTLYTALIRLFIYLITIVLISYFLEKKYQRYVVAFLDNKKHVIDEYRAVLWDMLHKPAK